MIYQGLFKIFTEYFSEDFELFFSKSNQFLKNLLIDHLSNKLLQKNELVQTLSKLISVLITELKQYIDTNYLKGKLEELFIDPEDLENISTSKKLFSKKIMPILNEVLLEEILFYIGGINGSNVIEKLEKSKILSLDFVIKLNKFKEDLTKFKKIDNYQKYIRLPESVCDKFCRSKIEIENLEDIDNLSLRIQVFYLVYRIIHFFKLQRQYDFSPIKNFLKNNLDKWLIRTPLVTLSNPEVYYCGIFLANELKIDLDAEKINDFLDEVVNSIIDETYTPLIEETDEVYYFLKACEILNKKIEPEMIENLIKEEEKLFYENDNLILMETSKLAVILKIFALLKIHEKHEIINIEKILLLVKERINSDGVKQYPDGAISAEATYYTIFIYYMRGLLKDIENFNFIDSILEEIYTTLAFIQFSEDINFDLISELFYSCESLKLLNCIETKETLTQLSNYLLPDYVTEKIKNSFSLSRDKIQFRYYKIERISGHTIEII